MTFLESTPNQVGRLFLALLAGTGLRIGEGLALRWRDVDLGTGTLRVTDSKTAKGVREVHLSPSLREQLALARAKQNPEPDEFVIATATGRVHNASNLRRDVLAPTVRAANQKLFLKKGRLSSRRCWLTSVFAPGRWRLISFLAFDAHRVGGSCLGFSIH